jgi:hypothetical protein
MSRLGYGNAVGRVLSTVIGTDHDVSHFTIRLDYGVPTFTMSGDQPSVRKREHALGAIQAVGHNVKIFEAKPEIAWQRIWH